MLLLYGIFVFPYKPDFVSYYMLLLVLSKDEHGMFNMHGDISACFAHTHTGDTGPPTAPSGVTVQSECLLWRLFCTSPPQCSVTARATSGSESTYYKICLRL